MKDWKKQFNEKFNTGKNWWNELNATPVDVKAFISQVEAEAYQRGKEFAYGMRESLRTLLREQNEQNKKDIADAIERTLKIVQQQKRYHGNAPGTSHKVYKDGWNGAVKAIMLAIKESLFVECVHQNTGGNDNCRDGSEWCKDCEVKLTTHDKAIADAYERGHSKAYEETKAIDKVTEGDRVIAAYERAAKVLTAELFHEIYERLAPDFGYETREDTKAFDPNSKNGKLMVATVNEVAQSIRALKDE